MSNIDSVSGRMYVRSHRLQMILGKGEDIRDGDKMDGL